MPDRSTSGWLSRAKLSLLGIFLCRNPVIDLQPRNGSGPETAMESPLEHCGRRLDPDHTAGQLHDLIAERRPRRGERRPGRPVNGKDLNGRVLTEPAPPAAAEAQASRGNRRHA